MFIDWISIIVYFVSLDVFEDDGDIIWVKKKTQKPTIYSPFNAIQTVCGGNNAPTV